MSTVKTQPSLSNRTNGSLSIARTDQDSQLAAWVCLRRIFACAAELDRSSTSWKTRALKISGLNRDKNKDKSKSAYHRTEWPETCSTHDYFSEFEINCPVSRRTLRVTCYIVKRVRCGLKISYHVFLGGLCNSAAFTARSLTVVDCQLAPLSTDVNSILVSGYLSIRTRILPKRLFVIMLSAKGHREAAVIFDRRNVLLHRVGYLGPSLDPTRSS